MIIYILKDMNKNRKVKDGRLHTKQDSSLKTFCMQLLRVRVSMMKFCPLYSDLYLYECIITFAYRILLACFLQQCLCNLSVHEEDNKKNSWHLSTFISLLLLGNLGWSQWSGFIMSENPWYSRTIIKHKLNRISNFQNMAVGNKCRLVIFTPYWF